MGTEMSTLQVIGGYDENLAASAEVFGYSEETKKWTSGPELLEPRAAHAAVAFKNTVYVLGGAWKGVKNDVFALDLKRQTWEKKKTGMKEYRTQLAAVATADGYLVAIGGLGGPDREDTSFLNSVERLDANTVKMVHASNLPDMREPRRSLAAVNLDGTIFAIGGFAAGGEALSSVERWDPLGGVRAWHHMRSMKEGRHGHVASAKGIKILVAGGKGTSSKELLATAEVYDACANCWESIDGLQAPRWGASCAAVPMPGRVYTLGGFDDSDLMKGAVAWDWEANSWQQMADLPAARFCAAAVAVGVTPTELERTFANSNFKKYHTESPAFEDVAKLWEGIEELLRLHLERKGLQKENGVAAKDWVDRCRRKVADKGISDLEVTAACIWTSDDPVVVVPRALKFHEALNSTLCDDMTFYPGNKVMELATRYAKTVCKFIVTRGPGLTEKVPWPEDYCVYRGSWMSQKNVDFFREGKNFRAVAFIATSAAKKTAVDFIRIGAARGKENHLLPVLFRIEINRDLQCKHAQCLDRLSLVDEEQEFLFSPYSAFYVKASDHGEKRVDKPIVIDVSAYWDNKEEKGAREDFPLALWM